MHEGDIVDIGIENGVIIELAPRLRGNAARAIDVEGMLTLPAFVNGQLHACKSFWRRLLQQLPAEVQALPRFEAAAHVKRLYTEDNIFSASMRSCGWPLRMAPAPSAFGDVDEDSGLQPVNALLRIRENIAADDRTGGGLSARRRIGRIHVGPYAAGPARHAPWWAASPGSSPRRSCSASTPICALRWPRSLIATCTLCATT
ncbi:MAG: hypothetical protein R2911_11135 [Caldilineaceae bacterium]